MAGPRRSLEALATQLQFGREDLVLVCEGLSDKSLLARDVGSAKQVVVYSSTELEIPLQERFAPYGAEKGRVLSLSQEAPIAPYLDGKLRLVVDLDIDDVLNRRVNETGVYYTEYASLFMHFFDREGLTQFCNLAAGHDVSGDIVEDILQVSKTMFFLFAEKERLQAGVALPDIRRYLQPTGMDWEGYAVALASRIAGGRARSRELVTAAIEAAGADRLDHRLRVRFRDFLQVINYRLYRSRQIGELISDDEMRRLVRFFIERRSLEGSAIKAQLER